MPFQVDLTRLAVRDLDEIGAQDREAVLAGITSLGENPFPDGKSRIKLKGFEFSVSRLRTRNHRALYRILEDNVAVLRIIDRRILERTIRRHRRRFSGV